MELGGWIPIDKRAARYLPNDRPFTKLEAAVSVQLDYDRDAEVTEQGYAELWRWSKDKVRLFLRKGGFRIFYPLDTAKFKKQRGRLMPIPGFNERLIAERENGNKNKNRLIRFIINKRLQTGKNIKTENRLKTLNKTALSKNENRLINSCDNNGLRVEKNLSENENRLKTALKPSATRDTRENKEKEKEKKNRISPAAPASNRTTGTASGGEVVADEVDFAELHRGLPVTGERCVHFNQEIIDDFARRVPGIDVIDELTTLSYRIENRMEDLKPPDQIENYALDHLRRVYRAARSTTSGPKQLTLVEPPPPATAKPKPPKPPKPKPDAREVALKADATLRQKSAEALAAIRQAHGDSLGVLTRGDGGGLLKISPEMLERWQAVCKSENIAEFIQKVMIHQWRGHKGGWPTVEKAEAWMLEQIINHHRKHWTIRLPIAEAEAEA